MKQSNSPVVIMVAFMIVWSMACAALGIGGEPTLAATIPPAPIKASTATDAPAATATEVPLPTATPTLADKEFFTEEFEDERFFDEWVHFLTGPNSEEEDKLSMEQKGDGLTIDLGELDMYFYFIYDKKTYGDVKITMVAENLGRNNNNVSMVCRLDYNNGKWYEFSVESGGVWYLYAFDDGYHTLDYGGAAGLKQGNAINEYGLECSGNTITMYVNGDKLKSFPDRVYNFKDGKVGFNISSLNVLPITVNVKSFDIAQP
ncbi:MAG: hypothetical protein HS100_03445 [Anaerolineales bacterium]|nr:hypothetical protein [Anaerolineales bacterium]